MGSNGVARAAREATIAVAHTITREAKEHAPRRIAWLRWLRRIHGWLGLWGAILGLAFGATGIIQNHRAILKLPLKKIEQTSVQLRLAAPARTPNELVRLLQQELDMQHKTPRIKVDAPQEVLWNNRTVLQPERWQISFDGPRRFAQAEYFAGNSVVKVTRYDANLIATLTRLHMAVGVDAAWILLADTIAGSLILLSVTGLLLWTRLHSWRLLSAGVALGGLGLTLWQTAVTL